MSGHLVITALQNPCLALEFKSMRFIGFFRWVFALATLLSGGFAQALPSGEFAQASENFAKGVGAFQKNELDSARASFQEVLKSDAGNPIVLFNLGLVEMKAGAKGRALGIWRKALALQPGFEPARRAMAWTQSQ